MKIYLVVDEWQYDGGCYIHAVYANSNDALIRQQHERRIFSDANRKYDEKWPNRISMRPLWSDHRFQAIKIVEQEVL